MLTRRRADRLRSACTVVAILNLGALAALITAALVRPAVTPPVDADVLPTTVVAPTASTGPSSTPEREPVVGVRRPPSTTTSSSSTTVAETTTTTTAETTTSTTAPESSTTSTTTPPPTTEPLNQESGAAIPP